MRAIRRLDGGMRFQKALESAPLFCRKHARAIGGQNAAVNFAHVQKARLLRLRNALAQAELRNSAELESLISKTLAYWLPESSKSRHQKSSIPPIARRVTPRNSGDGRMRVSASIPILRAKRQACAIATQRSPRKTADSSPAHAAGEALRRDL